MKAADVWKAVGFGFVLIGACAIGWELGRRAAVGGVPVWLFVFLTSMVGAALAFSAVHIAERK